MVALCAKANVLSLISVNTHVFDIPKAFASPAEPPVIFVDSLLRIPFATLLNKNAFAAYAAKAFVARTRFELVSPP